MTSAPSTNIWAQSHASKARRRPACCTTIASKSRQYRYKRAERGARRGGRPYKKRQEIRRQALGPREGVFGERQGTRSPVTLKIALHTAGRTGGRAGSPRPVGELSVLRKWTSISAGT